MTTYEENMEFLTQEQMRKNCPSAFTEKPSAEVSQHYTHIPTFRVVEDMEKLGWNVVSAQEVNARKKSTKGTQKHMITFRNTDIVVNGDDGDTVYPPKLFLQILTMVRIRLPSKQVCTVWSVLMD